MRSRIESYFANSGYESDPGSNGLLRLDEPLSSFAKLLLGSPPRRVTRERWLRLAREDFLCRRAAVFPPQVHFDQALASVAKDEPFSVTRANVSRHVTRYETQDRWRLGDLRNIRSRPTLSCVPEYLHLGAPASRVSSEKLYTRGYLNHWSGDVQSQRRDSTTR